MKSILFLMAITTVTACSMTSSHSQNDTVKINGGNQAQDQAEAQAKVPTKSSACQNTETSFRCVKVVEVYDGDTIFVDLPDQHPLFGRRMGVRIFGIDTPEKRSKNSCEKKKAVEAQAVVKGLLSKAVSVSIVNVQKDKYFRILGEVLADGHPVADELVKLKLAFPYHGEKKPKRNWCL